VGAALIGERAVPGLFSGVTAGWLLRVAAAAVTVLLLGVAMQHLLPGPRGLNQTLVYLTLAGGGLCGAFLAVLTLLRLPETGPLLVLASRLQAGRSRA
jgi:hypothetical protein